ncbi:hypothetical protein HN51_026161 [Arachis hypogaea]
MGAETRITPLRILAACSSFYQFQLLRQKEQNKIQSTIKLHRYHYEDLLLQRAEHPVKGRY